MNAVRSKPSTLSLHCHIHVSHTVFAAGSYRLSQLLKTDRDQLTRGFQQPRRQCVRCAIECFHTVAAVFFLKYSSTSIVFFDAYCMWLGKVVEIMEECPMETVQ